jgi:hypothetical protein
MSSALAALTTEIITADTVEVPPCVNMEDYHENDDGEENDDCAEHNFAAESVVLGRVG